MGAHRQAQDKALDVFVLTSTVIGAPIFIVTRIGAGITWPGLAAVAALIALTCFGYRSCVHISRERARRKRLDGRREVLLRKYGDTQIVERIMNRYCWQGQSRDQLRDALGEPTSIAEKILETKRREVWEYDPTGVNRFALRITLEDETVVGWD